MGKRFNNWLFGIPTLGKPVISNPTIREQDNTMTKKPSPQHPVFTNTGSPYAHVSTTSPSTNIGNPNLFTRAVSAVDKGTKYKLGQGGFNPKASHPKDAQNELDCSGFVSWVIGLSRHQPNTEFSKKNRTDWISTDSIFSDAVGPRVLFTQIPMSEVKPGDIYVYPDRGRSQGHTGIAGTAGTVIHCSNGSFRRTGEAIKQTSTKVFTDNSRTIAVRFKG